MRFHYDAAATFILRRKGERVKKADLPLVRYFRCVSRADGTYLVRASYRQGGRPGVFTRLSFAMQIEKQLNKALRK